VTTVVNGVVVPKFGPGAYDALKEARAGKESVTNQQ
jgi:predicted Fe-Mo cluster-binding NifX family protein